MLPFLFSKEELCLDTLRRIKLIVINISLYHKEIMHCVEYFLNDGVNSNAA